MFRAEAGAFKNIPRQMATKLAATLIQRKLDIQSTA